MPQITCALDNILNPTVCNDRGGFRKAFWFEANKVDWDAIFADPLQFDTTTHQIIGYTMIGGAVMYELTFEPKSAFYEFTFTRETDLYTILVQMFFKAKDNARRQALQAAIACCNVGMHIYANDGTQRVVAQDFDGNGFVNMLEPLAITRHLDGSGQLGTSRARDELDLGGEAFFAPLFANVDEANLPL